MSLLARSAVAIAGAAAALLMPAAAGAQAATSAIRVPWAVMDMRGEADGSVRVLTASDPLGTSTATMERLDPAGNGLPSQVLVDGKQVSAFFMRSALTSDGAAMAYIDYSRPRAAGVPTHVVRTGADGTVISDVTTTPGAYSSPTELAVGPTGAAAVVLSVTKRGGAHAKYAPWLVVQPSPTAPLTAPAQVASPGEDDLYAFEVFVGANGGGVVAGYPFGFHNRAAFLRRFSPTGVLGPQIRLAPVNRGNVVSAGVLEPSGRFVLAQASYTVRPHADRAPPTAKLTLSMLEPGSAAPTRQVLGAVGSSVVGANSLDLVSDGGGRTVVVAASPKERGWTVFDRAADGAVQTSSLRSPGYHSDVQLFLAPDGGVSAIWNRATADEKASWVMAAHQAPGASFPMPHPVTPHQRERFGAGGIDAAAQLPDGRLAIAVEDGSDPAYDRLAIVRP